VLGRLKRHPPGSRIWFQNSTTKQREYGTLIDEIWLPEPESLEEVARSEETDGLETAFLAQLVEWRPSILRIRITYHTRRGGGGSDGWVFAQTVPSMSPQEYRTLFRKMEDRGWFNRFPQSSSRGGRSVCDSTAGP
jgi:hypothetical protein